MYRLLLFPHLELLFYTITTLGTCQYFFDLLFLDVEMFFLI